MTFDDKILIVDDNLANVELLEGILEDDYNFETATSGEQAMEVAAKFQPDIILLDIMMPGIDGYQVCQMIRQDPKLNHAKIIMVSAKTMLTERLEGYEAGADDYLIKPFDSDELLAKVRVYGRLLRVEERDKLKNDLLDMLCLESNNPLNCIIKPLHNLLDNEDLDHQDRSGSVDSILQGVSNLQNFFEKVLILCALQTKNLKIEHKAQDLSAVVSEAVAKVKSFSLKKNLRIEQTIPNTALSKIDPVQMEYVLTTLLDNAIRFSSGNSSIDVKITQKGVYLNLTLKSEPIEAPTGNPAEQDINGLAELRRSNLAIARCIMEKHGGSINIEDVQGIGTDVTLQLPLVEEVA